ncbi:DUF2157 domain-containing protein [Hymenobacter qilianensis]|uniref:DUF2157 domain-containing protein n=1 Tax=Hymenobacter qilianensis TaxID=1385715 RepID=A0A7H0GZ59_9BACT|nr:DUF2157 domain-containing protein [Hymenobacter qilianensis]QNP53575.1 DUF2157 domain-containing protein [Hymenobacter qilianensis]
MGAYASGEFFLRRGNSSVGIGLVGLGLILFGAAIILTGQMYQLIGYDVTGLVAWAVAGTLLTYLYRSRFLFVLTVVIGGVVQGYTTGQLGAFSYAAAVLTAGGLGYYWWRRPDILLGAFWLAACSGKRAYLSGICTPKSRGFLCPLCSSTLPATGKPTAPPAARCKARP